MDPDIVLSHGSQYRVAYRMQQDIGIGIAIEAFYVGYLDAAQKQLASFDKPMDIVTETYSHFSPMSILAYLKSSGVVILIFLYEPSTTFTFMPSLSTKAASSVAMAPSTKALSYALKSISFLKACGVCTSTRVSLLSVAATKLPFSTSLIVGFTGTPAMAAPKTPAASSTEDIILLSMKGRHPSWMIT